MQVRTLNRLHLHCSKKANIYGFPFFLRALTLFANSLLLASGSKNLRVLRTDEYGYKQVLRTGQDERKRLDCQERLNAIWVRTKEFAKARLNQWTKAESMNKGLRSDWKGAKQNKATKDRRKEFARRGSKNFQLNKEKDSIFWTFFLDLFTVSLCNNLQFWLDSWYLPWAFLP